MSVLGVALSLPLVAIAVSVSTVPVWFAAKVVGTGHQEFWRVAMALILAGVLAGVAIAVTGPWGVLLLPVVFVVVFSKMLDASYLGAFVLCILAAAFQVIIAKVLGALMGGGSV